MSQQTIRTLAAKLHREIAACLCDDGDLARDDHARITRILESLLIKICESWNSLDAPTKVAAYLLLNDALDVQRWMLDAWVFRAAPGKKMPTDVLFDNRPKEVVGVAIAAALIAGEPAIAKSIYETEMEDEITHLGSRSAVVWAERVQYVIEMCEHFLTGWPCRVEAAGERDTLAGDALRETAAEPECLTSPTSAIPQYEPNSPHWMSNKDAAQREGLDVGTLGSYRQRDKCRWTAPDGMSGVDRDGRKWRRNGTLKSHPVYYAPSLKNPPNQTTEKHA